jgi:cellobiose-specific phosphotransferase system component IIC
MQTPKKQSNQKRALGVIFFVLLMDVIGITILFPIAPFLVKRYSDQALIVTMLSVIYAAAQFPARLKASETSHGLTQIACDRAGAGMLMARFDPTRS